jgi:hypothetical protein
MKASLITMLVLLAGCSSLRVQVGVMNPEIVRERMTADRLAQAMPGVMAATPTSVAQFFVDRLNIHATMYDTIRQAYADEALRQPAGSDDRKQLETAAADNAFPQNLRQDYDYWQIRALTATDVLQKTWPNYQKEADPAVKLRQRNALVAALDELEAVHAAVDAALVADLDLQAMTERLSQLPEEQRKSIVTRLQRKTTTAVAAQRTGLFDPGNIQHSPYAYYVGKALEKDWVPEFDKSVGRGTFGNTDIAIKALGPGNFTIKGVTFNPADVAAMAAKVTSQTVLLAAQVAGVPVKLSGAPDATKPGAALAKSSAAVSTALSTSERVDARMLAHRDALRRIAAALVRERDVIKNGTNAERKAALDSIKAVYESHASRLRVAVEP